MRGIGEGKGAEERIEKRSRTNNEGRKGSREGNTFLEIWP